MSKFHEKSADDYPTPDPNAKFSLEDMFGGGQAPKTRLGHYHMLSPLAGVRVSPLCLGAMSIGNQWDPYMGHGLDREQAFKFLDAFYDEGGNFIDTANNYQDEQSEHIIGEWMEARGNRDNIVLATKYTSAYRIRGGQNEPGVNVNTVGNSKKSLRVSLEASLKKLRTDYIDVLYVHWWDHTTPIDELMLALNDVVKAGKVLYLGISDTPAWVVSAANEYARAHALAQFVVYQGEWNLAQRDVERDIIPMCKTYGLSMAPWGSLGGGKFKTEEELKSRGLRGGAAQTDAQKSATAALDAVAQEVNKTMKRSGDDAFGPTAIALAWVRAKMAYCYPIVGGTSIPHLKKNIAALDIDLTPEQVKRLDDANKFNPGFPTNFIGTDAHDDPNGNATNFMINKVAPLHYVTRK